MDRESGADSMFGSAVRGTSDPAPGEDAGPDALSGAGEENREEEREEAKGSPARKVLQK